MNGSEELLSYDEALGSLRRLLLEPPGVPPKVATAALRAVLPPGGPSASMLDRWGREAGRGRMAQAAAEAARAAVGSGDPTALAIVADRWGWAGRSMVLGAAALARMEDRGLPLGDVDLAPIPETLQRGSGDVGRRIRRAFGEIPPVWRVLGGDHAQLTRWWWFHDAALRSDALVGEEPWVLAGALSETLGATGLAEAYRLVVGRFVHRQDIAFDDAAAAGRSGFEELVASARRFAIGDLDEARLRLPAARLAAGGAGAGVAVDVAHVVVLVRGLSVFAPRGAQPKNVRATS